MSEYYGLADEREEAMRQGQQPRFRKELNRIMSGFVREAAPIVERRNTYRQNNNTGAFNDSIAECYDKIATIQAVARKKIEDAYDSYLERLDRSYDIRGDRVDEKVLSLLDPSRVTLTQEEFDRLAKKFLGNYTMEAALRTYADRTGLAFGPSMGIGEKHQLAERVLNSAIGMLYSDDGNGLSQWLMVMEGNLFNEANLLTE